MPIQFRCQHCNQKLSITRRKAGSDVKCPTCAKPIRVPTLEEAAAVLAARQAAQDSTRTAGSEPVTKQAENRAVEQDSGLGPGEPTAGAATDSRDVTDSAAMSADVVELWKEHAPVDPWLADDDEEDAEEEFALHRPAGADDELDMTPMVDVTFLLLIFFMITASFSLQKSMQTEAPEPEEEGAAQTITVQDIEEASVIVAIDAEDNITVDDEPISGLGQLVDVLTAKMFAESPPRNDMLIEADYLATHGMVVAVTDAGIEAGMQSIRRVSRRSQE
jgi:biopolymer transport protein ExbD/phage FluMu protein Com